MIAEYRRRHPNHNSHVTIREILQQTINRLKNSPIESPQPEAEWLICDLLGISRTDLYLRSAEPFPGGHLPRLQEMLNERVAGRPLQYILGYTEFYGRRFICDERAMIPRPETEVLVEQVIKFVREELSAPDSPIALDLGTGCGIIAITLAAELPEFTVLATDVEKPALALARENAQRLGVARRIQFSQMSLFDGIAERSQFSAICANPPYISIADKGLLQTEVVDYEPHRALFAPHDGLSVIRTIIAEAGKFLIPGGLFALEIGYDQADTVRERMQGHSEYSRISVHPDLAGHLRIVIAVRN